MMHATCFGTFKHFSLFAYKNLKWSWKRCLYIYIYGVCYIQGIHKTMVRFQKLTWNVLLTLDGHNLHRQHHQLSKSLMCYQQFASHAYCGTVVPVSKMASYKTKAFCVLCFEVSRSVITVQREFRARFRNLDSCRCWRCRFCLCKVRNSFLVNFWFRTILLCIPCICETSYYSVIYVCCAVLCCALTCKFFYKSLMMAEKDWKI